MGRGRRKRENSEGGPAKKKSRTGRPDTWQEFQTTNESFIKYYKGLGLLAEEEFDSFIKVLQSELPVTFRINQSSPFRFQVARRLKEFQASMIDLSYQPRPNEEAVKAGPPVPISWYPSPSSDLPLGWYFEIPKRFLKKANGGAEFNQYLVLQSEVGTITRQEAVSMLPPLFMDVRPHHYVLDMCAAPGSKTVQFIEAIHAGGESPPRGIVIANDAERTRCDMLSHQLSRLNSPCVAVTHHKAQVFPSLKDSSGKNILFDRILADVPCSGDGTLRKNPDLWVKWNTHLGIGNHHLQLQIASRAFELLKPGGRMVYSTCSMNPAENESVVAALIQKYGGQLEIADVSNILPSLKRRNGITSWKIMARDGTWYSNWDEIPNSEQWRYPKTLFPPPLETMKQINIERCVRLMPHDQDTGGFFVTVLDKRGDDDVTMKDDEEKPQPTRETVVTDEPEVVLETPPRDTDAMAIEEPTPARNTKKKPKSQEALVPLSEKNVALCETARTFYGITPDFSFANLLSRSEEAKPQKVYFFNQGIREIITHNPRLKVVFSGIRMFHGVTDEATEYRIVQTGVNSIAPYVTKRLIPLDIEDLMILLCYEDPLFDTLSESGKQVLQTHEVGSCIFVTTFANEPMYFVGWRGKVSVKVLLKKAERKLLVQYFQSNGIKPPSSNETTTSAL